MSYNTGTDSNFRIVYIWQLITTSASQTFFFKAIFLSIFCKPIYFPFFYFLLNNSLYNRPSCVTESCNWNVLGTEGRTLLGAPPRPPPTTEGPIAGLIRQIYSIIAHLGRQAIRPSHISHSCEEGGGRDDHLMLHGGSARAADAIRLSLVRTIFYHGTLFDLLRLSQLSTHHFEWAWLMILIGFTWGSQSASVYL